MCMCVCVFLFLYGFVCTYIRTHSRKKKSIINGIDGCIKQVHAHIDILICDTVCPSY
jgi:hypothetical protein